MRVEIQLNENSVDWVVVTIETESAGRQAISEVINRALIALGEKNLSCYDNSGNKEASIPKK